MDKDIMFSASVEIDLDEVRDFVNNNLASVLLEATPSFGTAAFCLSAILDKLDEVTKEENAKV